MRCIYPPCPNPVPTPAPAPSIPKAAPTPTAIWVPFPPPVVTTATTTTVTTTARTVAYIIAPFAIVGGSYVIGRREVEIHPYGGFVWPGSTDKTSFRDEPIFGVKASTSLSDYFGVEGNFGYINHFESRIAPTTLDQSSGIIVRTVHAFLYDINGVVNNKRTPLRGAAEPRDYRLA